jgi:hypothetical protein
MRTGASFACWVILCGLIATPVRADMSGTYVGKGPTLAVMVQIVETGAGNFTGRYAQIALQADGKIEEINATVAGARNGETVVATIKTADFFAASVPVSGTYRSGVLHLTGGANLVLTLSTADEADFRAQVAALTARGQQIIDARAHQQAAEEQAKLEADRSSRLQNLTSRMIAFNTKADGMLPKFAPVEQQWRGITEKMRGGLARQKSIYGGGTAAVARGQITVALNQAAIEANQIHINAQTSYQTFDFNSSQLAREAAEANGWCQGAVPDTLSSTCAKFLEAQTAFAKRTSALRAAFAELEAAWKAERHEHEAIIQTSQRVQ